MDEYECPSFTVQRKMREPRLGWKYWPRVGLPDYVWELGRRVRAQGGEDGEGGDGVAPLIEIERVNDARVLAV